MKVEPRAMGMFAMAQDGRTPPVVWFGPYPKDGENLYTLADVLAALRDPSEAMIEAAVGTATECDACIRPQYSVDALWNAMLDQFERDQGSAT